MILISLISQLGNFVLSLSSVIVKGKLFKNKVTESALKAFLGGSDLAAKRVLSPIFLLFKISTMS
jgi:hypothetical protein